MLKTTVKEIFIEGPAGQLETLLAPPTHSSRGAFGIICHPHPLFGGNMHNKVVTTLSKTFQGLGLSTVRFNFRGVGQSGGSFDKGIGEVDDLIAVIEWVQRDHPNRALWLAGFSFGAYVAAKVASEMSVNQLVTIAPAIDHFPRKIGTITCPWVLVQGGQDEVVDAKAVLSWAESRYPAPKIIVMPSASHFFHGQLVELREALTAALK